LEEAGIQCEQLSFIKTEASVGDAESSLINSVAEEKRIVIFTSVKAVEAVTKQLRGKRPEWQIFCISGATKEAVTDYFGTGKKIISVAEDAAALAEHIILFEPVSELIFFCGNRSLHILQQQLAAHGIRVKCCKVYDTTLTPQKVKKPYDAILFFSPSGVESFLLENEVPPETVLFSIGKTTAKALNDRLPNTVMISPAPGKQQLVETVIAYYKA
jgi:uroporphyrinogen-III synthase